MLLRAEDYAVHSITGVLLHLNSTVSINVHRCTDVGVTHAILYSLHINTALNKRGTVTVSQIMESDVRESGCLSESLPLTLP